MDALRSTERPILPNFDGGDENDENHNDATSKTPSPPGSQMKNTDDESDNDDRYDSDEDIRQEDRKSSSSSSASSSAATGRSQRTPTRRSNVVSRKFWSKRSSPSPSSFFQTLQPKESTRFLDHINQSDLTPKMRAILVDWLIELSEHFHFSEATLHTAITMADRVLACGRGEDDTTTDAGPLRRRNPNRRSRTNDVDDSDDPDDNDDAASQNSQNFVIPRDRYQLLGATCVWLACKIMETSPPKAKQIAYVSDNIYDLHQIITMERRICNALGFAFFREPTPYQFLLEFLRASHEGDLDPRTCPRGSCGVVPVTNSILTDMANYLLELGRIPFGPATRKPSLLAASAVYLARVTLGVRSSQLDAACDPNGYWTPTLAYYSGYSKQDLKETVLTIHAYQVGAECSDLKSTFTKYRPKKYNRVAIKTAQLQENLGF
jgi:cyclin A